MGYTAPIRLKYGGKSMTNLLQWIPNFFKGMIEVLKEFQKMAGGGKRGQIVFWVFFVIAVAFALLFVAWAVRPAYDSVSSTLSHFNIHLTKVNVNIPSSFFTNLGVSLLITIISLVFLSGIGIAIGLLLAFFTNVAFAPYTTTRIDKLFSELLPIMRKMKDSAMDEDTQNTLVEAEQLYNRWNRLRVNKIARWITPKKTRDKYNKEPIK
jgi:hypothetical protein